VPTNAVLWRTIHRSANRSEGVRDEVVSENIRVPPWAYRKDGASVACAIEGDRTRVVSFRCESSTTLAAFAIPKHNIDGQNAA